MSNDVPVVGPKGELLEIKVGSEYARAGKSFKVVPMTRHGARTGRPVAKRAYPVAGRVFVTKTNDSFAIDDLQPVVYRCGSDVIDVLGYKKLHGFNRMSDAGRLIGDFSNLIRRYETSQEVEPDEVFLKQARRNAKNRALFFQRNGVLTPGEVGKLPGVNGLKMARKLIEANAIFSVDYRGDSWVPTFQFDEAGNPMDVVARILRYLSARFSSAWEVATWFDTANSWLDGRRPADLLKQEPERVVVAARRGADRGGF